MTGGTDPAKLIAWLTSPNGAQPSGEPAGAVDPLAEARAAVQQLELAAAENGSEAIKAALRSPETIDALARVAAADRAAYEAALLGLKETARDRDLRALERAVSAEMRRQRGLRLVTSEPTSVPVHHAVPDAPVPPGAVVPAGWRLGPQALARERSVTDETGQARSAIEVVAPAPIVIAGRLVSIQDHAEAVRIAWLRDGRWHHVTIDRATSANSRDLVRAANFGLPVTSGTASEVVDFLAAFEAANLAVLPRARVSNQLGWQGKAGEHGFLWGRAFIKPDGEATGAINLDDTAPSEWREEWIAFRGEDDGELQLADSYCAEGTFEAWRDAAALAAPYPHAIVALYASLVPVLLEVLDAPNFVVDWAHMTSTGKTTTLRLAASVWGPPDERATLAVLHSWDATRAWIERTAATLHSLPLILDDTKRAKSKEVVTQTVYDFVSGRGRGRGSPGGTRKLRTWRTVLLSSGEQRITDFSQDGGTRPRVLELWGPPFGGADRERAALVQRLNLLLAQHYGHAGPRFVRYVLSHRDQWPAWREQYRDAQRRLLAQAGDNPFAGRIAEPVAALAIAEALAHAALDLPWPYRSLVSALWETLTREASEADRSIAALEHALSWATGNQGRFYPRASQMPAAGWAGRWDDEDDWEFIGFLPHVLRDVLEDAGFDYESTVRIWRDRGWLVSRADRPGRAQHSVRIENDLRRVIAISRDAALAALED